YSLEEVVFETKDGEPITLGDTLADHGSLNPQEAVEWEEHKRLLAEAIDALPDREKLVVALYCYEELTLKEIGEVMGISSSRVCQLYTHALMRLRNYLSAYHQEVFGRAPEVTKRRAGRRPKHASSEEAMRHGSGRQPPALAVGKDSRRGKAPANPAKSAAPASTPFKYRRGTTRPTEKGILPLAV
ncbi:MAG: sigma-70 family RNA polymerase sigma factor, partial [Abditibacteriales bacterium]|nr:sigma-70 family RNA polymerase sigma factor [Abditibacteriales bacterium]